MFQIECECAEGDGGGLDMSLKVLFWCPVSDRCFVLYCMLFDVTLRIVEIYAHLRQHYFATYFYAK